MRSLVTWPVLAVAILALAACSASDTGGPWPPLFVVQEPAKPLGAPTAASTRAADSQADGESLEDFLARLAAANFLRGQQQGLVALSRLENPDNVYQGVATRDQDVQRCWELAAGILRPCPGEDPIAVWRERRTAVPQPHVFMATLGPVSDRADRLTVVFDFYHRWRADDPMDGFHVFLRRESPAGRWRVEGFRPVY